MWVFGLADVLADVLAEAASLRLVPQPCECLGWVVGQ
jgi:hypothetical protein